MRNLLIAAMALTVVSAQANARTYAQETCDALHRIDPSSVTKRISVTCRWPAKTTYFLCESASGAKMVPTVDAEAIDSACVHPFFQH